MKKNGFTLIELLAAIVILGLLCALIVSKVNDTIKNSKKKSEETSINNLVKELNAIVLDKKANLVSFDGCIINFDNGSSTCVDFNYSGELPDSGSISVDSDGNVNGSVCYGERGFLIENNNFTYEECES